MIILKITGLTIIGLYGLYLVIGLILSLSNILWAITILLNAPLKGPKDPLPEHEVCIAPLAEQIKEIPGLLIDWLKATIFWIILPFLIVKAFLSKDVPSEAG